MKQFGYLLIFVAGVLCSVGVLHIFQRSAVKPRPFYSLPSDLQVREDFQVQGVSFCKQKGTLSLLIVEISVSLMRIKGHL